MAVHQHRKGWRGSLTLTTPVYNTKAEAEAALADLRARVQTWRLTQGRDRGRPLTCTNRHTWSAPPGHFRPSCDYPLVIALHGSERLGL
jgi:hypothetical protein